MCLNRLINKYISNINIHIIIKCWVRQSEINLLRTSFCPQLCLRKWLICRKYFHPPFNPLGVVFKKKKISYVLSRVSNYLHTKYHLNMCSGFSMKRQQTDIQSNVHINYNFSTDTDAKMSSFVYLLRSFSKAPVHRHCWSGV